MLPNPKKNSPKKAIETLSRNLHSSGTHELCRFRTRGWHLGLGLRVYGLGFQGLQVQGLSAYGLEGFWAWRVYSL